MTTFCNHFRISLQLLLGDLSEWISRYTPKSQDFITYSFYHILHFMSKALKSLLLLLQWQNYSFRRKLLTSLILNYQSTSSGASHFFFWNYLLDVFFFPQGHLTKGYVANELFQNLKNSSSLQKKIILQQVGRDRRKWKRISCGFWISCRCTDQTALKSKKALTEVCVTGQTVQCNSHCERKEKFSNHFNISDFISLKHNWE